MRESLLLVTLVFCLLFIPSLKCYELTVLHVNDIHVRFDETNKYSGNCKEADRGDGGCFGGVARLVASVKDIKEKEENVIFLNGGDFYQGNVWYTHFKWRVVAHFANLLNFTAMSPGNHEFDDHVPGFVPFVQNASFPLVAANVDFSQEPTLQGLIPPSVTVTVGGRKIGIIGYVTTDTPSISNSDRVKFVDEVKAIAEEARKLKASGVDILIALGHSGYEIDQAIAAGVPDIDLVVGGHSHSFLYTGEPQPSVEKPSGPYPTLVTQKGGRKPRVVPVVQAYAYTKYLGYFKITFDDQGEMVSHEGKPKLLDHNVKQDEHILRELEPWRKELQKFSDTFVAETSVLLLAKRGEETNLGNFIADSMIDWYSQKTRTSTAWTAVALALINSGGIRGSFEVGNITMADVFTVLPFGNTIDLVSYKGKHLRATFEEGATKIEPIGEFARMLQVSGFQLTYDPTKPVGSRLVEALVRCSDCKMPKLEPLEDDKVYNVTTVNYLVEGGDGLGILAREKLSHEKGPLDVDVFVQYAQKRSPIVQGVENRIRILDSGSAISSSRRQHSLLSLPLLAITTFSAVIRFT